MINPELFSTVNQTSETWIIWWAMLIINISILLISIIGFGFMYKKTKKEFLSINRIAYFSVFLCIFMLQVFIFAPLISLPIPFSFDSITVIAVGFLFGPIEGIIFGQVADTLRVFIHGWSYGILPGTMYPLIGLISGIAGIIYHNKKTASTWTLTIWFQAIVILFLIALIPAIFGLNHYWDNINNNGMFSSESWLYPIISSSIIAISVVVMLSIMEVLFYWFLKSENKREDLFMFVLLTIAAFADRGMELVIRPFTQFFTGYETIYWVALLTRVISTTYLVPTVALTSYGMIKAFQTAMNIK